MNFKVNASDLSGISIVLLEYGNKNFNFVPLEIDEKGNGLYSLRIRLNSTKPLNYRIIGIDKLGRESVYEGEIVLSDVQKFLIYCANNNLPLEKSLELAKHYYLVDLVNNKELLNDVIQKIKQKDLAFLVAVQIGKDNNVVNKIDVLLKALEIIDGLKDYNNLRVAYLVGNSTNYGFYSFEGIKNAASFVNRSNIDFPKGIYYSALADAGHFVPEIFKYKLETYYFVLQVGDVFYVIMNANYGNKDLDHPYYKYVDLDSNKKLIWEKGILPYARFRLEKLNSGEFIPIDERMENGDLAKLAEWADSKVVEAAARSLWPYDALADIDLSGKDRQRAFHDGKYGKALNYLINNFEGGYFYKIRNIVLETIERREGEMYKEAVLSFKSDRPPYPWYNSDKLWKSVTDDLIKKIWKQQ